MSPNDQENHYPETVELLEELRRCREVAEKLLTQLKMLEAVQEDTNAS